MRCTVALLQGIRVMQGKGLAQDSRSEREWRRVHPLSERERKRDWTQGWTRRKLRDAFSTPVVKAARQGAREEAATPRAGPRTVRLTHMLALPKRLVWKADQSLSEPADCKRKHRQKR